MTDEQIEKLKEKNSEYSEICEILDAYDRYIYLYHLYFCKKLESGEFEFCEEFAKKNAEFLQNWKAKKEKIEARMKKNKYFSRASKAADEKELRLGKRRYLDLMIYCGLEKDFDVINKNLVDLSASPESDLKFYIEDLEKRRVEIEKVFARKSKQKEKI